MERLPFEWTQDCQGKQDYDGSVLRVSTRYWPRGGGFAIFRSNTGVWEDNDTRPEIRPSAKASILWLDEPLVSKEFEADTEAEVKAAVEEWVAAQVEHLRTAVLAVLK